MYEFKLTRPLLCPSVLLTLEGTKGQVSTHIREVFFICGVMCRFGLLTERNNTGNTLKVMLGK